MWAGKRLEELEKTRAIRFGERVEERRAIVTSSWPAPVTLFLLECMHDHGGVCLYG